MLLTITFEYTDGTKETLRLLVFEFSADLGRITKWFNNFQDKNFLSELF
jgi:hypothetical protein